MISWQELKSVVYFNHDKERSDEYDLVEGVASLKWAPILSASLILVKYCRGRSWNIIEVVLAGRPAKAHLI